MFLAGADGFVLFRHWDISALRNEITIFVDDWDIDSPFERADVRRRR
jgi:hypothetical protein